MRTALTIHRLHGKEDFVLVSGPETSLEDQKLAAKTIAANPVNDTIAEIQVWRSDTGRVKRYEFLTSKQAEARAAAKAAAEAPASPDKAPAPKPAAPKTPKQPAAPKPPKQHARARQTPKIP